MPNEWKIIKEHCKMIFFQISQVKILVPNVIQLSTLQLSLNQTYIAFSRLHLLQHVRKNERSLLNITWQKPRILYHNTNKMNHKNDTYHRHTLKHVELVVVMFFLQAQIMCSFKIFTWHENKITSDSQEMLTSLKNYSHPLLVKEGVCRYWYT